MNECRRHSPFFSSSLSEVETEKDHRIHCAGNVKYFLMMTMVMMMTTTMMMIELHYYMVLRSSSSLSLHFLQINIAWLSLKSSNNHHHNQEEPYVMLKPSGMFMTGNDRFHGYLVDLLNKISNYLGFNHEIRLSRDGKYGELMDGVWDGSIGEVLSEVDCLCP